MWSRQSASAKLRTEPRNFLLKGWEAIPRNFAPAKFSRYTVIADDLYLLTLTAQNFAAAMSWPVLGNSVVTEASFSPLLTVWWHIQLTQMPRFHNLAIFVLTGEQNHPLRMCAG